MIRLTPVAKNLLIINVLVFLAINLLPGLQLATRLALFNVKTELFAPYQLFTYMFAQQEFFHMLFNMIGLAVFGPILETTWGSMRFVAFYLICGIGAGIFNIAIDYFSGTPSFGQMIGASGAIYGLMTAFGILYPNMEMMIMFIPVPVKAKYLVLGFAALAVYSALNPRPGDHTAHFAHLGGIVAAVITLQFWRVRRYWPALD